MKPSDIIQELLKEAEVKRGKAPTREISYWQGQVDALTQAKVSAEICELKNK